jgi:hypothetical protein
MVSMTALPPLGMGEAAGPMIGLLLIAIGTGGIKPCVSAFGGDQFTSDQEHLLQSFFSVFYFAINAGSLLSMLLTPVLRGNACYQKIDVVPPPSPSNIGGMLKLLRERGVSITILILFYFSM